jgi:hypothetical protein
VADDARRGTEREKKRSKTKTILRPPITLVCLFQRFFCASLDMCVSNEQRENAMPTLDDVLAEKTYKQDGLDIEQRVFYTLVGEAGNPHREKLHAHRNSKAIALLFKTLSEKHHITGTQIDEMLLEVVS